MDVVLKEMHGGIDGTDLCVFEKHLETALFTMKLHLFRSSV